MTRRKTSSQTPVAVIPVVVTDQDEALQFYTESLGLEKREDITFGPGMRWLTVAPRGQRKPEIALATPERMVMASQQERRSGQHLAGVFDTEDCCMMYERLSAKGVTFARPPTRQVYGIEALFVDPYGNMFSLLQPSPEAYRLCRLGRVESAA